MNRIWSIAFASLYMIGFAAITTAAAIGAAMTDVDARSAGRVMMVDAQFDLARELRR